MRGRSSWLIYLPHLLLLAAYLRPVGLAWRERVVGPFLGIDAILQCGVLEWTGRNFWQPGRWVDLPIFHPAKGALTYMDTLLGQALLVWPLRILPGTNAVLLYNAAWLASLVIGVLACLVLWRASGARGMGFPPATADGQPDDAPPVEVAEPWSAVAAATLLLVVLGSPYTLSQLGHLNQLPPLGPPLAAAGLLIAARGVVPGEGSNTDAEACVAARPQPVGLWLWAIAMVGQAAWGTYGLAAASVVSGVILAAIVWEVIRRGDRRAWLRALALPGFVAVGGVLLLAWPYLSTSRQQSDFRRSAEEVRAFSADVGDLVNGGAYRWSLSDLGGRVLADEERAVHRRRQVLHPGWVALGLAVLGFTRRRRLTPFARWSGDLLLVAGVIGVILAFGDSIRIPGTGARFPLPLAWLRALLPPLESLRAVTRFTYLTVLATAWWAGIGVASLAVRRARSAPEGQPRHRGRLEGWRPWIAVLALVALLVESWPVGLPAVTPYLPTSLASLDRAADPLAARGPGAVLTLPSPATEQQEDRTEARWLLRSLAHGHPVTGGVTGWVPPHAVAGRAKLEQVLEGQLELSAIVSDMRAQDVRYVELATAADREEIRLQALRWSALFTEMGFTWRPSAPGYVFLEFGEDAAPERRED